MQNRDDHSLQQVIRELPKILKLLKFRCHNLGRQLASATAQIENLFPHFGSQQLHQVFTIPPDKSVVLLIKVGIPASCRGGKSVHK